MEEFIGTDKLIKFFEYLVGLDYGFKITNCVNPSYDGSALKICNDITTLTLDGEQIDNIIITEDVNDRPIIDIHLSNTRVHRFIYPYTNARKMRFINVGESEYVEEDDDEPMGESFQVLA